MTFNSLSPDPLPVETAYVPRVFGFRVQKTEPPSGAARLSDVKMITNSNGDSPALKVEGSDPSDSVVRAAKRKGRDDGTCSAPALLLESTKRRRKNNSGSNTND